MKYSNKFRFLSLGVAILLMVVLFQNRANAQTNSILTCDSPDSPRLGATLYTKDGVLLADAYDNFFYVNNMKCEKSSYKVVCDGFWNEFEGLPVKIVFLMSNSMAKPSKVSFKSPHLGQIVHIECQRSGD